MDIFFAGDAPSAYGPEDWFTGKVRIDAPFSASAPDTQGGATVTFEPGARTAWHTHPRGQLLIVTQGTGWVQKDGEPRQDITVGDTVWIGAGERHWHGATDTTAMTHIAVAESEDGSPVSWQEHVSDDDYLNE